MGLDEMTGSPNITIVPDPSTFRVLPWAPGVGWMLCDEYFNSGVPFHFSPRQLLRKQIERLADQGLDCVVGLEIEWYLLRVAEDHLGDENTGMPGMRGRPIADHAGRARLFLSLRIQHGPDAAGALGARRSIRADRAAAALDRERVGTGPARMHLRGAAGAGSRRPRDAVPHRDAADLPPHGLLRELHVPARRSRATIPAAGTCISRWSTPRADATCSCRSTSGECLSPLGRGLSRRPAETRRRLPRFSRRRPSTAIAATGRTRWRPTAPPGATTTAA